MYYSFILYIFVLFCFGLCACLLFFCFVFCIFFLLFCYFYFFIYLELSTPFLWQNKSSSYVCQMLNMVTARRAQK